ncbi:hypothetical protein BX661DRAFT_169034 [Kickxella alabastrina]|uniref:uncharacterized protein n=1 Tax=Kickxella alabastrina TaxID=61397 RepID=UPI00221EC645|nr:uncharacterized protein BX661DRAFT_169034 [Kickxella alabastrina]KAI7833931.1 hypothetical protein BX661DRAFT_169034 [Kickxella alabastrina]
MLSALIPESKLPATISQLRAEASEGPRVTFWATTAPQAIRRFAANGAEAAPSVGERRLGEEQQVGGQLTKVIRIGRKRFLTQVWGGGTLCDITGKPRQVEVQFHCDPNGPERISLADEVAVCRLARAPRESREILHSMLALMYGDSDLRVKFADPNEPSGPSEPSEPSEPAVDKGGQTLKQMKKKAAAGVTVSVVDKEDAADNLESNDKDEQPRAHDEL